MTIFKIAYIAVKYDDLYIISDAMNIASFDAEVFTKDTGDIASEQVEIEICKGKGWKEQREILGNWLDNKSLDEIESQKVDYIHFYSD